MEGGVRRELKTEVLRKLEDVGVAWDWSLAKIAVEERVDTSPIYMRGVGTAVLSEGRGSDPSLRI